MEQEISEIEWEFRTYLSRLIGSASVRAENNQKELRDRQDKLKREYSASPENCKNNMLLMAIDSYQDFL